MAVNLSPVGGVAAQFFDNSGQVLTGGKLYTYLAGTTTSASTYTTNSGISANSNPIVLNAAGRVADSGEIWLTDGINYKFVLKDSNDVQIAVWDNISGINSNFVNYTLQEQTFTATQGQTVFTLTGGIQYTPATNNLSVFVNGSKQVAGTNYLETSSTVFTFVTGLNVGDVVDAFTAIPVATNVISSNNVSYNPPFSGSVSTNVQAKLAQTVSAKDFGAVGNGIADDTSSLQNALTYCGSTKTLFIPSGTYKITDSLILVDYQTIQGDGWENTKIVGNLPNKSLLRTQYGESPTYAQRTAGWDLNNFQLDAQNASNSIGLNFGNVGYSNVSNVGVYNATIGLKCTQRTYYTCFINLTIQGSSTCAYLQSDGGANEFINANFGFTGTSSIGVNIISGSWKFNGGTLDTNTSNASAFFKVGQNSYASTASIQISNVYVEGVNIATELIHFYDNVILSNIYGIERRNVVGPMVFENTTIYSGIYIDSQSQMNPQGSLTKKVAFGRNPSTNVIDAYLSSLEGNTLQVRNLTDTGPGYLTASSYMLNGVGYSGVGIYFNTASPEGVITAAAGSLCLVNTSGGTGNTGSIYKKTAGVGNTGWVAI
jgi:hypothetical protein